MGRSVVVDLAGQAALARDLAADGVFVPDILTFDEEVELVLRGGGDELRLRAKCVWVNGAQGSGLQLFGCDDAMKQRIAHMAAASGDGLDGPTALTSIDATDQTHIDPTDQSNIDPTDDIDSTDVTNTDPTDLTNAAPADGDDATIEEDESTPGDTVEDEAEGRKIALNVHERLRGLTLVQQIKVAKKGEVSERIVLERLYGKAVWEPLLRNPRITGPEVARIARMGALPRPLVELIVGNGAWLQIPEVRRALLSNPRLGVDQITKILRMLPKQELKMAAMQTAYPFGVRDVAKRMLKEQAGG